MRTGCLVTLVVWAILVAGVSALIFLQLNPPPQIPDPHVPGPVPQPAPAPAPPPKPDPEDWLPWVDKLNEFSRTEDPKHYNVSYGFVDYQGKTQRVSCNVKKEDHQALVSSYGFNEKVFTEKLNSRLKKLALSKLAQMGLTEYVSIKFFGWGGYNARSSIPENIDLDKRVEILGRIPGFYNWLETNVPKIRDQIELELFQERGFRLEANKFEIDHRTMVLRSGPPLADCFGALKSAAGNYGLRQSLGLLLAFFQEIRYEIPPYEQDGQTILGLWVATEVLINGHGDCDSKTIAFSALCRKLGLPVVVIDLPKHVLAAVEGRPGPGQKFVRIHNRYFLFCEVAGPAKLRPGHESIHVEGSFRYTLLEPEES